MKGLTTFSQIVERMQMPIERAQAFRRVAVTRMPKSSWRASQSKTFLCRDSSKPFSSLWPCIALVTIASTSVWSSLSHKVLIATQAWKSSHMANSKAEDSTETSSRPAENIWWFCHQSNKATRENKNTRIMMMTPQHSATTTSSKRSIWIYWRSSHQASTSFSCPRSNSCFFATWSSSMVCRSLFLKSSSSSSYISNDLASDLHEADVISPSKLPPTMSSRAFRFCLLHLLFHSSDLVREAKSKSWRRFSCMCTDVVISTPLMKWFQFQVARYTVGKNDDQKALFNLLLFNLGMKSSKSIQVQVGNLRW